MDDNKKSYTTDVGERYTYFISKLYKFIENNNIQEGTLSIFTISSPHPFAYHLAKCGECGFKTMVCNEIRRFYSNEEGEEDAEEEDF